MATVTPKPLVPGTLLTAVAVTLYTAPPATTAVIRGITLTNTDSVARTVTLHIVTNGELVAVKNRVFTALSLTAGQTVIDDTLRAMNPGDFVAALASTTNVVAIRVDGAEVTA